MKLCLFQDLKEAFENVGIAMFNYMTDLQTVDMTLQTEIEAQVCSCCCCCCVLL